MRKSERTSAVRRAFERWLDAQDVVATLAGNELGAWVGVTAFAAFIIAFAAYVPGTRSLFHLNAAGATVCFVPALGQVLVLRVIRGRRNYLTRGELASILLLGLPLVQFFVASLVAWSQGFGAAIFATLYLFTCGFHGSVHRATLREPFLLIGTLFASLAAMSLNRDLEHLALFAVVIPAGITLEAMSGTFAKRQLLHDEEAQRLRAAVAAQILARQGDELQRLSQQLVDVLGYSHDMNNAVTALDMAAEALEIMVASDTPPLAEVRITTQDIRTNLTRVRAMLRTVRQERPRVPDAEQVAVLPVLEEAVTESRARFRQTNITISSESLNGMHVRLLGGPLGLHRVFQNLIANACEGNGTLCATQVLVSASAEASGTTIRIVVEDDGPGFDRSALDRPIEGFSTTKSSGTGLGLYTSERIVRASGGVIERANRPNKGASVSVVLPMEHT